mmetsp:Transcript_13199/g.21928  ORF Transcript_13199/g.21928 Transcript_13199/m.21928 type:complete len:92 (-) Transcript_13199:71-346(-)
MMGKTVLEDRADLMRARSEEERSRNSAASAESSISLDATYLGDNNDGQKFPFAEREGTKDSQKGNEAARTSEADTMNERILGGFGTRREFN